MTAQSILATEEPGLFRAVLGWVARASRENFSGVVDVGVRSTASASTSPMNDTTGVSAGRGNHEVHDHAVRLAAGLRRDGRQGHRQAGLDRRGLRRDGRVHGQWNNELVESGEFVDARGLAAPVHTRRVQLQAARRSSPTGRTPRHRKYSPATPSSSARASTGPPRSPPVWRTARPGRVAPRVSTSTSGRSIDGPRRARTSEQRRDRPTTSRTCCAGWRRRSSARSCAATGISTPPRTPCRRRCSPAAAQWPADGVPDNPRAWLITVAARRLTDLLRSEQARRRREDDGRHLDAARASGWRRPPTGSTAGIRPTDDSLILLFLCCHPALSPASQIALTLRAVGGLTTAEIARAFLVPEATMTRRITRAKQRIKDSGVPFGMPPADERAERLAAVLHVLYLIFNEGYASTVRARPAPRRAVRRGDPADPAGAPAAARRRRGGRAAGADAAHRRAAARPHRTGRRRWSRWPSRTARRWNADQIARASR